MFYDESYSRDFRVSVKHDVTVMWAFGGSIATGCKLKMDFFPFDDQVCKISIENWVYRDSMVSLINNSDSVSLLHYETHGIWNIKDTLAQRYEFEIDGIRIPAVEFHLALSRKPRYYLFNIVVPCVLLVVLVLLMFWLPVNSGEKTGLGVTLLLAFAVFQLMIAENTPKTSDSVPLLGKIERQRYQ